MADSLWVVPFGKHKGDGIEDLSTSYLEWLMDQDWFAEKFEDGFNAIRKELRYREDFGHHAELDEDRHWNRRTR